MKEICSQVSPLYVAFKKNEVALSDAIRFAAIQSAAAMGGEFSKVYHRTHGCRPTGARGTAPAHGRRTLF